MTRLALLVVVVLVSVGCTSPEASRGRGGGPGADPGNRGPVVVMHEGSRPYYGTPRLIGPWGSTGPEPGDRARRASLPAAGERR